MWSPTHSVVLPGPESTFLDNLRYLHTFVPLQNLVDSALLRLSGAAPVENVQAKLAPYPCWVRD